MRGLLIAGIALMLSSPVGATPDDQAIRSILAERVDRYGYAIGIVVGVIGAEGRRVLAHGRRTPGDDRPLDGDTLFEIGSITKVFTALLLADMVRRGEVALDDTVQKYLPTDIKMPERGRAITLKDLATHYSSLPRLPTNFAPANPSNPYVDYTPELLYRFLSGHALARDVGVQFEYSNLGMGLLGHVLARRANMDFDALLRARILDPLGLDSTRAVLTPALAARLAPGHDPGGAPQANWDLNTLAGAGGLRSSANDLLTFLAAAMGASPSPPAPAFADALAVRLPRTGDGRWIALGWHVSTRFDDEIAFHGGGTGGYRSFLGYSAQARRGVVVLSNTNTEFGVEDIGLSLLNPRFDAVLPKPRLAIVVEPAWLNAYVGRYRLSPTVNITVTSDGGRLFAQLTNQSRFELFAEARDKFFYKIVEAQIDFDMDGSGRAQRLVLRQSGKDMPAERVD